MLYGAPVAPGDVLAGMAQGPACRLASPLEVHDLGGQITDLEDLLHLRFGLLLSPGGGEGREPITGCSGGVSTLPSVKAGGGGAAKEGPGWVVGVSRPGSGLTGW